MMKLIAIALLSWACVSYVIVALVWPRLARRLDEDYPEL